MPRVRMSIFSRLLNMEYIFVVSVNSWNVVKESSGPLPESKVSLIREDATSVQKKRESLNAYLLVRAL